ncbi:MAG: hypothetical protein ACTMUB_04335 [cyanobacterium endosymbiont of Rhopalodia musculus]
MHSSTVIPSVQKNHSGSPPMWLLLKTRYIFSQVKNFNILLESLSPGTGIYLPDHHFNLIFGAFHRIPQTPTKYAQALYRYCPYVSVQI